MHRGTYCMVPAAGWHLSVDGAAKPGDIVEVLRKNGTVHRHKIGECVMTAKRLRLWTIIPVTRDRLQEVYGTPFLPHAAAQESARLR